MTEIWKQDPMLIQFIHEQVLTNETAYRWSQYIIPYKLNNALYLYNTFTKQCVAFDGKFDSNKCYSYKEIENDQDLFVLAKQYFFVPENRDECAFYEGILRIARALLRKEKYSAYTILPTLGCNARCIYCYEEGMKQITMSEDVTQKAIEFILSSCNRNEPVQLTWFGGEPILCAEIIDQICKALSQSEVNFFSTMVSNGSLITDDVVKKMKNDWNLKRIQISMDGDEDEYIHRKNYYAYKDNYIRTIKAVEKMAKEGISVKIRCNVDTGNIDRIPVYIDDMTRYVSNKKNVEIYFSPLFDAQDDIDLWRKCLAYRDRTIENGFNPGSINSLHHFKVEFCMVENPYGSTIIYPDGSLYSCEHFIPGTETGTIWGGISNQQYLESFCFPEKASEQCRTCSLLPECTPLTRCPIKYRKDVCSEIIMAQMQHDLKNELENYKKADKEMSNNEAQG